MDKLKEHNLKIRESDSPDRLPIDFSVEDKGDNVAWVWGEEPSYVEVECEHANIDWGDDNECGVCEVCGAQCQWRWEYNYDNGYKAGERAIYHWKRPKLGGIIKQYLKENYGG